MLFKLKLKMVTMSMTKLFLIVAFTIFCLFIVPAEAAEQDIQIHGFAAQGLIDVNGSNFVDDDGGLSTKLTEFGINGSYRLSPNLRLAGQVVYLNGGNRYEEGVRVDYALLDWTAYDKGDWKANIYVGRFKNNHWLYSSSRDIPFARPSIILPQSVYFDGFRDIAVGADGAAIKLSYSDDNYGDFDFNLTYGASSISTKQSSILLSDLALGKVKQDFETQTSIYWQPAFSSWRFGVSYLDSDFSYETAANLDLFFNGLFSFQFSTLNALYEGEKWELSGEIYQSVFTTKGFYHPAFDKTPVAQGMYMQSRYKLNDELSLLARYEYFYNDKNDKDGKKLAAETGGLVPAYFGYHRDTTVGLSYDFASNLRLRLEYHWFQGAGRLTPVVMPNPRINSNENWQLWAMQLMYWF